MFYQAHNFKAENSSFVNIEGSVGSVNISGGNTGAQISFSPQISQPQLTLQLLLAINLLEKKRMPGAEVDSSDRFPPPRCHRSTRKKLRARIWKWLKDKDRSSNMFWLVGSAGVGKSAVAQTTLEEWQKSGQSGAGYFFSRPNHRDDPFSVIPTLVYRLAHKNSDYRNLVEQRLADPTILEKDIPTQFDELIVKLFQNIHSQKPFEYPFLIVLDGLDECNGRDVQRLFIRLIGKCAELKRDSPLLWLVCSRPEWHLKGLFSDTRISCYRDEISIDDEARQDVQEFLTAEFEEIRRMFPDVVPSQWPSETQLRQLGRAASGLFVVASTVTMFVEKGTHDNPVSRLQLCLDFIAKALAPDEVNPLRALDLLYEQIMNDIPSGARPIAMRIICLRVLYPRADLSVCLQSNFLGLDQASFYSALQGLHSVLLIPPQEYASKYGIHFHHASFADFLKDRRRSGQFHTFLDEAYCDIAICALRWYNAMNVTSCRLVSGESCLSYLYVDLIACEPGHDHAVPYPPLSWLPETEDETRVLKDGISKVATITVWMACCCVMDNDAPKILAELHQFSFCHSTVSARNERQFMLFLNWLHKVVSVLRICPLGLLNMLNRIIRRLF